MPATTVRADLVILAGAFLGVSLLVTTLHQRASATPRHALHPLDTLAHLLLGASLLLLALFELAEHTLWANARVVPAWAGPAGATILLFLLASAGVAGTFALLRRSHLRPHQHHRRA